MEKLKGWKKMNFLKKTFLGIGVLVMALLFCFGLNEKEDVKAAGDYAVRFAGEEGAITSGSSYKMRKKKVTATYTDSDNKTDDTATISWKSDDPSVLSIGVAGADAAGNVTAVTLIACGAGTADLTAYITVNGQTTTFVRTVEVGYAISQDEEVGFTLQDKLSDEAIMALAVGDTGTLEFLFPLADGIEWQAGDVTVVEMVEPVSGNKNRTGKFKAVGTGVTTIVATYTNAEGELDKDTVEVYVGPKPMKNTTVIDSTVTVEDGDIIHTGAILKDTNKVIKDCIEWVVWDKDGKEIATSKSGEEKVLKSSPYSPNLTIDAKAGTYTVTLYTAGVYSAGIKEMTPLSKTFKVNVVAKCSKELEHSLQVNDTFDIADAYNMETTDFEKCFRVTPTSGAAVAVEEHGLITANNEGTAIFTLTVIDADLLSELLGTSQVLTEYIVEINVYRGFVLNYSIVTIAEGATLKLRTDYKTGTSEKITWKSADTNYVTVDEEGIITGKRDSSGREILVTATMVLSNGKTLNATCKVTVKKTAETITLVPTKLRLQAGESQPVKATFDKGITAIPGLQWIIEDESIASFEVASDNSVMVTGNKAGTTILTAVNADNFVAAYCEIIVLSPITNISLAEGKEMTVYLSQEALKLHPQYNMDATDVELLWSSSDSTVATVDETGFVQLKKAGITIITVMPEWNPKNVMTQCRLTVLESTTGFTIFEPTITLEVGEKYEVEYNVSAEESSTTITWTLIGDEVVTLQEKTKVEKGVKERQVIEGKAPGMAYLVASTKEGQVSTCKVIVKQKAAGVKLDQYSVTVAVGESVTVKATPDPENSTEVSFGWKVKDNKIATVDKNGKITGVSAGETIVTVKPATGNSEIIYVTVYDKVMGMTLNKTNVTIVKGETFTLKPVFMPSKVTNTNVKWASSNEKVASISKTGKIKGLKGGTTVITAISEDGGYFATCIVTVQERITSVKLNKSEVVVGVGKTYKLKATVKSNSASNPKVKWITSNKKIVKVSKNGNIRGVKVGTATITVKVTDGTNKKATCKVRVVRPVTKVTLNKKVLNIVVGQTGTLKATIKPSNATIKTVTWSSADPTIAEVDQDGAIFGLSLGQTKVTATAKDNSGKKASCYVNVIEEIPASSIVLSAKSLTLVKGDSEKIGYSIVPRNNTDQVFFDSDNRSVATVNGSGKVYGKRAGVANITISTSSGKQATVKVTVLGLNKTKLTMEQYDTETLFIDGTTTGITWFTSNPSVATVQQGKVVARKAGKCAIYAKVNGISLKCNVVVKKINK